MSDVTEQVVDLIFDGYQDGEMSWETAHKIDALYRKLFDDDEKELITNLLEQRIKVLDNMLLENPPKQRADYLSRQLWTCQSALKKLNKNEETKINKAS